jgi:signal transduction histidine kinase
LRETLLAGIVVDHRQIAEWERHSRETYESAAALVAAEIARIDGRALDAMDLYEKSIRSSRLSGSIHTEAVAHEVAARFYLGRGFETTSDAYLRNARECYRKWGAAGKVAQLERLHPELAAGAAADTRIEPDIVEHFDLATVVKTSEAVSNEFGLSRLIDTLMTLVLEHTGAHRGILILPQHNELQIGAEAKTEQDRIHVLLRNAPISAAELPTSIVNLVARTRQGIIIDDAQASNQFSEDPYFSSGRSRSVLCLPLVKQTKLIGIIFLENNLAASVFTPAKVSVLKLLASQAAISMENASLEEKDALVEALQKSQSELVRMSRLTAVGELVISIAHEVNQPLTAIIMNADVCLRWMNNEKPSLAEARKAAERVIENGKRAAEVVRTIRGLAVKSMPEMSSLDINEATKEMLSILRAELRQNNVHLETAFTEGRNMVTGNKVQLQQVLLNLSMNAIESMAAIEGRRILSISSQAGEDDTVVVSVTDNGLGFDESRIEQMFEALVTTKPQGMGMGLSISKSIVEAHGGRLWATSASPRGASFHFSVPTIARE